MSSINPFIYQPNFIQDIINKQHSWDDVELSYIRSLIRTHLGVQLNNTCYYCRTELKNGNSRSHIEHIVHKDKYVEFAYRPENLTLSCEECNKSKGVKETLAYHHQNSTFKYHQYPLKSDSFIVVHSYLDNYEDHIEVADLLYKAKNGSLKGKATIEMCSLYRLRLIEDKAKSILNQANVLRLTSRSDMEICDIIQKNNKLPDNFEEYFEIIIELCKDDALLRISNILKTINLDTLEQKKLLFLVVLENNSELQEGFQHYSKLIKFINDRLKLKQDLIFYLQGNSGYISNPNGSFLFTNHTIQLINTALQQNILGIHQKTGLKLLSLITNVNQASFPNVDLLNQFATRANELYHTTHTALEVLNKKTVRNLCQAINPIIIAQLKKQLESLGNHLQDHPQVKVLKKIDMIYQLNCLDVTTLRAFQKDLKSFF
ncbi:HNH endonuclease [Brevibacillus brevis]|uniref:HNH endonuclease n=1 Tax=Brevibacillus brevis TaxID=1393 RepID=UPI0011587D5D|nr:HNH endonuclease [Lysinibacillus sp. SDF0063]TQR37582.1 hypothetical protein C7Y45_06870 [Lysinibacillus sp. SDF0063]